MRLHVLDDTYEEQIEGFSFKRSVFGSAADTLSVQLSDPNTKALNTKLAGPRFVSFEIDERVVFLGRVQSTNTKADGTVNVSCADYRQDFVAAYIDPATRINKGESLEQSIGQILAPLGVQTIEGDWRSYKTAVNPTAQQNDRSQGIDLSRTVGIPRSGQSNEGAWQMAQRICERYGCIIHVSDDRSKVALIKPSYDQSPSFTAVRDTSTGEINVEGASLSEDYSQVPTVVVSKSRAFSVKGQGSKQTTNQASVFGQDALLPIGNVQRLAEMTRGLIHPGVNPPGVLDIDVASGTELYRPRFISSQEARTQEELDHLVQKQVSTALSKCFQLSYSFPGFGEANKGLYLPDTIWSVRDDVFGIDEDLYCSEVEMTYRERTGPTTNVELIYPGSYFIG